MFRICKITILLFLFQIVQPVECQTKKYKVMTIGFYNVENLFDTIDDPDTIDEDYTLDGKNHYSHEDYKQKLKHMAKVISEIGSTLKSNGPVILGLAEIENFKVLHDLVQTDELQRGQYQIIHQDSPDKRGIDVALLYRQEFFSPLGTEFIEVKLWSEKGQRIYTRDILYVYGILEDEELHILVNHWPSRRGGKTRSNPKRIKAAYLVKQITDRILIENSSAKIIIMGDFNDDPGDESIKNGLLSVSAVEQETGKRFFNPMERMHKKGFNTLAYRDGLNLFDQIIICNNLIRADQEASGYLFFRAGIYNPSYLIAKQGKYRGYPLRSFENNRYSGGYSDHFPVYIELIRPFSN
jgi:exonuclease III